MRWLMRLSHGVNQEIHSMAIISQDAIKLGCSGGQGKIQIRTLFQHTTQFVLKLSRILYKLTYFFYKTKPICEKAKWM